MPLDLSYVAEDVADLMTHRVDVEQLVVTQGTRGAPVETWVSLRTGVDCLILPGNSRMELRGEQFVAVQTTKLIFDAAIEAGATHRYLFGGRVLYPKAAANVAEAGVVWIVDAEEVP